MADRFIGTILLRGANARTSALRFALKPTTYAEAKTALDAIVALLANVTEATIVQKTVSFVYDESASAGFGDIFERATIAVHVNDTGEVDKFAVINIPAPPPDIFMGEVGEARDIVNVGDSVLGEYIDGLAANVTVSDGETINVSAGTNGMKSGRRTLANVKLG